MHSDPALPICLASDASPYGVRAGISPAMPNDLEKPLANTRGGFGTQQKPLTDVFGWSLFALLNVAALVPQCPEKPNKHPPGWVSRAHSTSGNKSLLGNEHVSDITGNAHGVSDITLGLRQGHFSLIMAFHRNHPGLVG